LYTYKILFGYVDTDKDAFFKLVDSAIVTRGHSYKLYMRIILELMVEDISSVIELSKLGMAQRHSWMTLLVLVYLSVLKNAMFIAQGCLFIVN